MSKMPSWGSFFKKKAEEDMSSQGVSALFKNVSLNEDIKLNKPQEMPQNVDMMAPHNSQEMDNNSNFSSNTNLNTAKDSAPQYAFGVDPNRENYRYRGNDEFLNEEGRDSGHLYIGPGEPLVPQKNRFENQALNNANDNLQNKVANPQDNFANNNQNQPFNANNSQQQFVNSAFFKEQTSLNMQKTMPHQAFDANLHNDNKQNFYDANLGVNPNFVQPDIKQNNGYMPKGQMQSNIGDQNFFKSASQSSNRNLAQGPYIKTSEAFISPSTQDFQQQSNTHNFASPNTQVFNEQNLPPKIKVDLNQQNQNAEAYNVKSNLESENKTFANNAPNSDNQEPQNKISSHKIFKKSLPKFKTKKNEESSKKDSLNSDLKPSFSLFLFIRQLLASFFTHTNLDILAPKLSLKFGPTYPSSMPLPYFFIGLVLGFAGDLLSDDTSPMATQDNGIFISTSPLILTLFLLLTGIKGFRGFGDLLSIFAQRRADSYIKITTVIVLCVLFCLCFNFFEAHQIFSLQFSFILAAIFALSAFTATSLNFGLNDDPVDSFGSLSLQGLLISGFITFVIVFLCLSFQLAISVIGIAILLRLIVGFYLNQNKACASRNIVCGMQYITMLLLLLDLLFLHLDVGVDLYGPLITK